MSFNPSIVVVPSVQVHDLEQGLKALADWQDQLLQLESLHPLFRMKGTAARAEVVRLQRLLAQYR